MNLLTKQKEIHRQKTNSHLPKGRDSQGFGEGHAKLLYLKWITKVYCTAHGTLLNVMWQPGWEGGL